MELLIGDVVTDQPPSNTGSVKEYFASDEIVDLYVTAIEMGLTDRERRAIARYFTDTDGSVLDIGCGTGRATRVLDSMGFDVVGLDLSEALLSETSSRFGDINFCMGDVCSLPFGAESFDYALFTWMGIDHIAPESQRIEALREVERVLKPNGIFVFRTHNLWSTYVIRSLDAAGVRKYLQFWYHNLRNGRVGSHYKIDNSIAGEMQPMYYIRPRDQLTQLRDCGFAPIDVLRPDCPLKRWFQHPQYVAQKRS